jgi:putative ABC transport system ATP-binding protein
MLTVAMLTVENLGRQLDQRWLWRRVNFELEPQMRLGLVGPSGSGKTLLLRSLVQLDGVDEGEVSFEGQPLFHGSRHGSRHSSQHGSRHSSQHGSQPRSKHLSLPLYRTKVMYLSQRPTLFEGTVAENLQMVFQLAVHQSRRYEGDRILSYLDKLNRNPDFLGRPAPQLSGGEGQILGLLRALQLDPQVLLLDEPTASLDPDSTARVEALLEDWLRAAPRRACIWTSHDAAQIERVTDGKFDLAGAQDAS